MGPLDDIGPYAETVITTEKSDVQPDREYGIFAVFIGAYYVIGIWLTVTFFGLLIVSHIGLICMIGPIVIGYWTCAYYGNNSRLFKWQRKQQLSDSDRERILRRLSGN